MTHGAPTEPCKLQTGRLNHYSPEWPYTHPRTNSTYTPAAIWAPTQPTLLLQMWPAMATEPVASFTSVSYPLHLGRYAGPTREPNAMSRTHATSRAAARAPRIATVPARPCPDQPALAMQSDRRPPGRNSNPGLDIMRPAPGMLGVGEVLVGGGPWKGSPNRRSSGAHAPPGNMARGARGRLRVRGQDRVHLCRVRRPSFS